MGINETNSGFSKAMQGARQAFNRLWLHNYLALFLRYSGFVLLLVIAYLHFVFHGMNRNGSQVEAWMVGYLLYLAFLEILNRLRVGFYDRHWFIGVRIFSNLFFLSWLINVSPLMHGVLVFAFLIPILSSIVYFPQKVQVTALVFALVMIGIFLAGMVFQPTNPLAVWQFAIIIVALLIATLGLQQTHTALMGVPEGIDQALRRMRGTLELSDIVDQLGDGLQLITDAEAFYILIIDPDDRTYITNKSLGLDLRSSFEMDDLINTCKVLRDGRSYMVDDLGEAEGQAEFGAFLTSIPRSIMIHPLRDTQKRVLGLMMAASRRRAAFDDLKKIYFGMLGSNASLALENSLAYRRARLGLLNSRNSADALLEADRRSDVVRILVGEAASLIGSADGCVLHRYDKDTGCLEPEGGIQTSENGVLAPRTAPVPPGLSIRMCIGQGIAGHALQQRKLVVADEARKHPRFISSEAAAGFVSLMSAPILDPSTGAPLGTLSVSSRRRAAFTSEDQSTLMYLARQAGITMTRLEASDEWRVSGGILKKIFEATLSIDFSVGETLLAHQLVEVAHSVLPFSMVRLRLFDPLKQELVAVAAVGYPPEVQARLMDQRLPLAQLQQFLKPEYQIERSYLIPSSAPGWHEFADTYLHVPSAPQGAAGTWDRYDAFFTPLTSENGDLLGFVAWDGPQDNTRPSRKIVEAVGAFASMAGWSIDLARAYRRIAEQRDLIKRFIVATTNQLEATHDTSVLGDVAVDIGRERLGTEACSFFATVANELELRSSTYLRGTRYIRRHKPIKAEVGCGLSSWVARTGKPLYFNSKEAYQKHDAWAGETEQLQYLPSGDCRNLLFVPILAKQGDCLGVLSFENKLVRGALADFTDADVRDAGSLAEELGLSLELANQLKNARELEQLMLEDDLHELKNMFYYGLRSASDNAAYWLQQDNKAKANEQMTLVRNHAGTILGELYNLHNAVKKKYYEIEDFGAALQLIVDTFLDMFRGVGLPYHSKRARVQIDCASGIQLTPSLRYTLIRIVSGALLNAIKHSGFLEDPAVEIRIDVRQEDDHVRLVVEDNGCGMVLVRPGYGITRMRELVRFLRNKGYDVKFDIETEDGVGTKVLLTAPVM